MSPRVVLYSSAADNYLRRMYRKLTEQECLAAVAAGDFAENVRAASPSVAVILTQSWCPQWRFMEGYAEGVQREAGGTVSIFYVEYDKEPFFETFMEFKEDVLRNREVPYVRYYRDGKLTAETNFISKQGFRTKLGLE